MKILPLEAIEVPEGRQRQAFDDTALGELIASIQSVGLMHPLVLREGRILVAGERRFRALQSLAVLGQPLRFNGAPLEPGHAPCVDMGELAPAEQYEAELDENLRRADLTWQEKAVAIARLAELKEQSGATPVAAVKEVAQDLFTPEPANRLAAEHLTRQAVTLAAHMDDPDVAKAKTQRDAFKILRAKVVAAQNTRLAAEVGKQAPSALHTLVHDNCLTWLQTYTGPKFDVLLTDPPYGMDAEAFGDGAGKFVAVTHEYDDSAGYALSTIEAMLRAAAPHMKDEAHLYLYCDIDHFVELKAMVAATGWKPHRTPLIHLKREGGRVPWPECGPRRAYELVLYAQRGNKPVTAIMPDVFDTSLTEGSLGHGAQKPIEGFINLLKRSVRPGDRILDPFAGTGTALVAGHSLGCRVTCIELEAPYYGIAVKRLEQLK